MLYQLVKNFDVKIQLTALNINRTWVTIGIVNMVEKFMIFFSFRRKIIVVYFRFYLKNFGCIFGQNDTKD